MKTKYWICWDLSNGHWQEHCYLWVFNSPLAAWWKYIKHRFSPNLTDLSIPKSTHIEGFKRKEMKYNINYFNVQDVVGIEAKHPTYEPMGQVIPVRKKRRKKR